MGRRASPLGRANCSGGMIAWSRRSRGPRRSPGSGPCSREPTLAALIVLHVAKRLPLALRDAEIELLDVLVLCQRFRLAVHDDAAVFQDVAVTGVSERHVGVLFGEQE